MEDKEMILEPEFKSNEEIRQELILKLVNEKGFVRYKGFGLKKDADRYRLYLDCFPDRIGIEFISYHAVCVRGCKLSVPYTKDLGTLLICIRSGIKDTIMQEAKRVAEDSLKNLLPYGD